MITTLLAISWAIMADRQDIIDTTLDHIHYYESRRGQFMAEEKIGRTESEYHMKLSTAKMIDSKYKNYTTSRFNQEMSSNPEAEKNLVVKMLEEQMEGSGISFENLELGEAVSYLSMMYNSKGYTGNPTTTKAFRRLANSRSKNGLMTNELKNAAKSTLDVIYSGSAIMPGLVNRRLSEQKAFDGNLSVDETYQTPSYTSQELIAKKTEFKNNSDEAKFFLKNYDLFSNKKIGQVITESGQTADVDEITGEVTPLIKPTTKPEVPQGVTQ
jgi:hypothetical protein